MTRPRLLLLGCLLLCLGCSGTEEAPVFGPGPAVWSGYDPAWAVVYPASGAERLLGACALASGEAWAVGTGGVVVHHAGHRWEREGSGIAATLADVATDGRLVCAVGSDGAIIVREGGAWRRESGHTNHPLRAVAFTADGTAWAGGGSGAGVLLRRTEAGWRLGRNPDIPPISALAAMGDTLVVGCVTGLAVGMAATGERILGTLGGPGVLRLAVSPSGTLFAAADSLYRYDAGRWVALANQSDRRLAANDSLVFNGSRSWPHEGGGSGHWVNSPGQEVVAICAAGRSGALVVGLYGAFSWLRDGAWRRDLGGGFSQWNLSLADGTVCGVVDRQVIAWDEDGWRVIHGPSVDSPALMDGLDREHLLLWVGGEFVRIGPDGQVSVPEPPSWVESPLIAPDGAVVGRDGDGILAWTGQEWRRELSFENAGGTFRLTRTRAGELFGVNSRSVWRRSDGHWRQEARLAFPEDDWNVWGGDVAAGRFPDSFTVVGGNRWLNWSARADTVQGDWRPYLPSSASVSIGAVCETAGAVYLLERYSHRVLGLRFGRPEARAWAEMTGPLPERAEMLRVEPDGAITAFARSTGRVWRFPARRPI